MDEFSVFNYVTKSKDSLKHFGFVKCKQSDYRAEYPVTGDALIAVRINTETKQVEVWRTHRDHPACDTVMRDDVLPFGLNVKNVNEFGKWLDDTIGDCWYALKDMETPMELQTCDEDIAEIERMDAMREEWS